MSDINLTITIPDGKVAKIIEAVLFYRPKPDGYTTKDWAEQLVKEYFNAYLKAYTRRQAELAIDTSADEV